MSYFDYYQPSKFGLTEVTEIDGGGSYDFDKVTLWRGTDGKLWAASDSGCSCPAPYEDHRWPTDFVEVRDESDIRPLVDHLDGYGVSPSEVLDFMAKVREALR